MITNLGSSLACPQAVHRALPFALGAGQLASRSPLLHPWGTGSRLSVYHHSKRRVVALRCQVRRNSGQRFVVSRQVAQNRSVEFLRIQREIAITMHGPVTQDPCCFGECCRRPCGGEPRGSRTGAPLENLADVCGHRPMNLEETHAGVSICATRTP